MTMFKQQLLAEYIITDIHIEHDVCVWKHLKYQMSLELVCLFYLFM